MKKFITFKIFKAQCLVGRNITTTITDDSGKRKFYKDINEIDNMFDFFDQDKKLLVTQVIFKNGDYLITNETPIAIRNRIYKLQRERKKK